MADETPPLDGNDSGAAGDPREMFKLLRDNSPVMQM